MRFEIQDLMIDSLPGTSGTPGRQLCGATSCAKSSPPIGTPPSKPKPRPKPQCPLTSCAGKSINPERSATGGDLEALRRQLQAHLQGPLQGPLQGQGAEA